MHWTVAQRRERTSEAICTLLVVAVHGESLFWIFIAVLGCYNEKEKLFAKLVIVQNRIAS